MFEIRLESEQGLETLLNAVLVEASDEVIDQLQVEREYRKADGMTSEPCTCAAVISAATISALALVCRLLERHLENERQRHALEVVANAALRDAEAGRILSTIAREHSKVSLKYELAHVTSGSPP